MNRHAKFVFTSILALAISACGSTPPPKKTSQPTANNKRKVETVVNKRSRDVKSNLKRAESASSERQATLWYTKAADQWIKDKNYGDAYGLLSQLNENVLTPYMRQQYSLFLAEALLGLGQAERSYELTNKLAVIKHFEERVIRAKLAAAAASKHFIPATRMAIKLSEMSDDEYEEMSLHQDIWQYVNQLEATALRSFQSPKEPELQAWLELAQITHENAKSPATMIMKVNRWKTRYPEHPASEQLPGELSKALTSKPYDVQSVAVILPLSGKYAKQGKAVQQGILSAFYKNQKRRNVNNLKFIDSEKMELDALEQNYEFVIGPLLKPNVEKVKQHFVDTPILMLNQLDDMALEEHEYTFALSPESEAEQAANKFIELGYKNPVVIASANSFGRRVANRFSKTFVDNQNKAPSVAYFSNQSEMKQTVESLLGTGKSKARISSIKKVFGSPKRYFSEARNRQDIDLIYMVGNANQTKIIKPFIDINTAPFVTPAPIFATSRSYSSSLNNADFRDLNGVAFSEIPWLLPGKAGQPKLAKKMANIWQRNDDDRSRLFAFGYDAYNIFPQLAQMRALSGFEQSGLSGKLSLGSDGIIKRQLDWAKYHKKRVMKLALVR